MNVSILNNLLKQRKWSDDICLVKGNNTKSIKNAEEVYIDENKFQELVKKITDMSWT